MARIHPNVVVKCPLIPEGLAATKRLAVKAFGSTSRCVFRRLKPCWPRKPGAWCVSPFIGRLDDVSSDGMELHPANRDHFHNYDFPTLVLVASIRHPQHVVEAALTCADICTMPYGVFQQLAKHPLTDIGLKKFLADWEARNATKG